MAGTIKNCKLTKANITPLTSFGACCLPLQLIFHVHCLKSWTCCSLPVIRSACFYFNYSNAFKCMQNGWVSKISKYIFHILRRFRSTLIVSCRRLSKNFKIWSSNRFRASPLHQWFLNISKKIWHYLQHNVWKCMVITALNLSQSCYSAVEASRLIHSKQIMG